DLAIAREISDRRGESQALGNLGEAYRELSDYHRAIELYEQGLAIAREIGDRSGEGIALGNLSLNLDNLGQRAEAIAQAEAALKALGEIESPLADEVRQQLAEWRKQT